MRVLRQFFCFFFTKKFHTKKKAKKAQNANKRFPFRCFLYTQKLQKAQNANKRLSLRCFSCPYKEQKSQKAQNVKQTTFFLLDVSMHIKILSFLCT